MSVIYLDMDGVLVDFFGGLAKKYNVGVRKYNERD